MMTDPERIVSVDCAKVATDHTPGCWGSREGWDIIKFVTLSWSEQANSRVQLRRSGEYGSKS